MTNIDVVNDPQRREFLCKVTAAVGVAGVAAACWPFISSMNPSVDVLDKATTEVDLSGINVGEVRTIPWQGKPVFVLHRTEPQIAAAQASKGGFDPEEDQQRVKQPQWLVVVGLCTHLGCVPTRGEDGWLCQCHGSVFDGSGRVLRGPAPKNLVVPQYTFIDNNKIIIGAA